MALESVTYVADLVVTNPTSGDPKSQGDDHLRNVKVAVKTLADHASSNLLASRALGASYTNSTGRPIFVHVRVTTNAAIDTSVTLSVGGVSFSSTTVKTSGLGVHISAMVPVGASYQASLSGSGTLTEWAEVR
jgi:hypothetical protein